MIPVAKANPAKPLVPALYLAGKIGKNDWRHDLIKLSPRVTVWRASDVYDLINPSK